jgi:peptidoglycan/LPS O-acetylase OafA/YrhL
MSEKVSTDTTLWKGAILPASVVAVFLVIVMSIVNGKSGLLGALLASITVIIFFSIHLLVARVSRDLDPMATMALAMFSYFAKVIFMGVFLLLVTKFTDRSTVDRPSFAICAILITMAWLFGEIRSFLKLRVNLPLPKREEDR